MQGFGRSSQTASRSLGLGGRMLTLAISTMLGVFGQEREMQRSFDMLEQCEEKEKGDEVCDTDDKHDHIQCGRCGHDLAEPEDIVNIETPHALSVARYNSVYCIVYNSYIIYIQDGTIWAAQHNRQRAGQPWKLPLQVF